MEQQTISVAKAGIMATLKSRCALLGAANPKFGRFDRFEGIAQQINMPPALISRFDLIFILTDQPNVNRDTSIAKHILAAHYAGELSARLDNLLNPGVTEDQVKNAMQVIQPEISPELLRKYVAYARRNVFPVITDEARKMLIDFYLSLRHQGEDPNAPVPVTARQLEALVRISEACARVRLSDSVTTEDAGRVISIVKSSLEQVMTDPETGKLDVDIVSVGMGKSQRDKVKVLRDIIRSLQDENEYRLAQRSEIIERAKEKMNLTEEQIEDLIAMLKTDGTLFEPRHGYIKLT
ncbi:MAG TPA: minichromosome maintenance protein MCM, partial [Candidatus Methanoperedenaceae archaeon]|nr:minichromosome maintenance protein MCM [Candidatus Methanoperedenaceae archaeon]